MSRKRKNRCQEKANLSRVKERKIEGIKIRFLQNETDGYKENPDKPDLERLDFC